MINRRSFLKLSAVGALALYTRVNGKFLPIAFASLPGGSLTPDAVSKYVTPLLIPPAMPRAGKLKVKGDKNIDYYDIAVRQFQQQILPAGLPATTVWGYGPKTAQGGPMIFHAPSLTIEAKANTPVAVKWTNELVDADGHALPHLLPVDPTLHWANPPGGADGRDTRPHFETTPGRYTGPVPMVTHVHGAVGVGDESDGYSEAWYLPAATDLPADFATTGTWYDYFKAKALDKFGFEWAPGSAVYQYPNANRASTLWYHDHALGITRLNVYAGPAGFYIVRDGPSDSVLDARTGLAARLPGPAPAMGNAPGLTYFEIPLAIQDRAFNTDGSLFYPDTRTFFDEFAGPFSPETDLAPIWNPEFFGNMIMVNGNTWPYLEVQQRRYRLRLLNGCDSRFLILNFANIPGVQVWQIGNEGGFLPAPVNISADHDNCVLLALAERADVIVDFTNVPVGNYVLGNVGPDEPFGGGEPPDDFDQADPDSTGQVLQFRVVPVIGHDLSTPPEFLSLPPVPALPAATVTRPLALLEMMSEFHDGPAAAMLGRMDGEGQPEHAMWADPITENPQVGDTEVWEFYNFTADAHPMHVHEVAFEVVNRQALVSDEEGEVVRPVQLSGEPRPPEAWESGFKDTVIAYPGEVTRIRAKFDTPGTFVWHCHIVSHEDNEMMRPYRIGPADPDAPHALHG
jgi:spore coat protein A, manganese oxidase